MTNPFEELLKVVQNLKEDAFSFNPRDIFGGLSRDNGNTFIYNVLHKLDYLLPKIMELYDYNDQILTTKLPIFKYQDKAFSVYEITFEEAKKALENGEILILYDFDNMTKLVDEITIRGVIIERDFLTKAKSLIDKLK